MTHRSPHTSALDALTIRGLSVLNAWGQPDTWEEPHHIDLLVHVTAADARYRLCVLEPDDKECVSFVYRPDGNGLVENGTAWLYSLAEGIIFSLTVILEDSGVVKHGAASNG